LRFGASGCTGSQSESEYLCTSGAAAAFFHQLLSVITFIPVTLFERQRTSSFVAISDTRLLPPGRSISTVCFIPSFGFTERTYEFRSRDFASPIERQGEINQFPEDVLVSDGVAAHDGIRHADGS
jgi:hypothetical protein